MDIDYDENDCPILPSLSDIIKQYTKAKAVQQQNEPTTSAAFDPINVTDFLPALPTAIPQEIPTQTTTVPLQPAIPPQNIMTNNLPQIIVPRGDDIMEPSNNNNAVSGGDTATNNTAPGCPRHNKGTYKDGPSIIWWLSINGESYNLAFSSTIVYEWENPVPAVANQGQVTEYHPNQKFPISFLAKCYLMQDSWFKDPTCMAAMTNNVILDPWKTDEYYFNNVTDPHVLEARVKQSRYNEDNPSFDTATCGPFQAQFRQAMKTEFNTLIKEFDCWEYVPNPSKNVLPSTWAFKIKRYPDG
jgi:hypothetical protein